MMLVDYSCRALLRLFPKDIRDAHGAEMRGTLLEVCETRSAIPELVDLAKAAIKARAGFPRIPSGHDPGKQNSGGRFMSAFASDFRQALRALLARPGTTAIAVSLLAIAIAACTTMFTVADAVLFNPVPYKNAERLVPIGIARTPGAWPNLNITPELVAAWRDSGAFERIEVHASTRGTTLDDGIEPRNVPQSWITPGTFDLIGVAPLRGRVFTGDDARQPVPPALISETLWHSQYGGDAGIIGRRISVEGKSVEIIGIMPADFRFPLGRRGLWRPLDVSRGANEKMLMWALGLVRDGMPFDNARRRADEAARKAAPAMFKGEAAVGFAQALGVRSFDAYTVNTVKVLFGGVLLVLLVACVNVANLLLAQSLARSRERAVRTALGASRFRLVRQALCESALLAAAAASGGLFMSWLAVSSFQTLLPEYIVERGANDMDVDGRAFAVTALLTIVVMLASGFLPAWFGTRSREGAVLRDNARGATENRATRRLSSALVIGEIAVAVTLLVTAALLVRSFVALATADRGLETRNRVLLWVGLPQYQEASPERRIALTAELHERLAAIDGVEQVIRLRSAPPDGGDLHFHTLNTDDGRSVDGLEVFDFHASPGFFEFFGIQPLAGRLVTPSDPEEAVVISESLSRALFPGVANPAGRTFRLGDGVPRQVVGMSRDILTPLLDPLVDRPEMFHPSRPGSVGRYALRIREGAAVRIDEIKSVVRSVHPSYVVYELASLDDQYREQIEGPETAARVASAFAAFGTLVCAAGLFSVLSLSVARRRREFGIRLAIGAHPSQLSKLVMRQTAVTLAGGIVLGVAGAFALARNLSAVLAGVDTSDVSSWLAVIALVSIAGIAAAWLPVRDARRTDPLLLLREE